jgi:hypothetical protein
VKLFRSSRGEVKKTNSSLLGNFGKDVVFCIAESKGHLQLAPTVAAKGKEGVR